MYNDKLYIHTSKYDVAVSKSKFVGLTRMVSAFPHILQNENFKTLHFIYCYKDGCIRFLFCDFFNEKREASEVYDKGFEEKLNQLIEEY